MAIVPGTYKIFWDATPEDKKIFVADPAKGSRHNRGCAVDLSLFDLKTGQEVKMPSEYDEMTERSHINYSCSTPEATHLRALLRGAMRLKALPSMSLSGGTMTTRTGKSIRSLM